MAQSNAAKVERRLKVKRILEFSSSILSKIRNEAIDPSFDAELRTHIYSLPIKTGTAHILELENSGTELWNLAMCLSRDQKVDTSRQRTIHLLRIFAFFLIDSSYSSRVHSLDKCVLLLKVAFTSVEDCFDQQDLGFAVKVLERAANYVEIISQENTNIVPEDIPLYERLKAEYFFHRMVLAWKQSKLDVVEHMFKKATNTYRLFDIYALKKFGHLLYEIGRDLSTKKQHDIATMWLGRAYDLLSEHDLEHLNDHVGELQMTVLYQLVKCLLALHTDEDLKKANDLIDLMERDYPDKPVVSLLRLDLLAKQHSPDLEVFFTTMMRVSNSMTLTMSNFKLLMYHLHNLRKMDSSLACKALDELLSLRLFPVGNTTFVEHAIVMRFWISILRSNEQDQIPIVSKLMDLLDLTLSTINYTFSALGAHAAQTLIWRQIDSTYNEQRQYEITEAWCHLALHPIFENAGHLNKIRICRKIMSSALARGDFANARTAFFSMTDVGQFAPESQYLLFKLALYDSDAELAASSLENLANSELEDATELLHSCVLEAQETGDRHLVTAGSIKVLENFNSSDEPRFLRWPPLLKSTIRLLRRELESELQADENVDKDLLEEICNIFETVARSSGKWYIYIEKDLSRCEQFRIDCEWFFTNCFNIVIETLHCAHPLQIARLCRSCIDFADILFPGPEVGEQSVPDVSLELYRIQAHYMAAVAYVKLAREEEKPEASLHYRNVDYHGGHALKAIEKLVNKNISERADTKDWIVKNHLDVLVYELEALMHLKDWNRIPESGVQREL